MAWAHVFRTALVLSVVALAVSSNVGEELGVRSLDTAFADAPPKDLGAAVANVTMLAAAADAEPIIKLNALVNSGTFSLGVSNVSNVSEVYHSLEYFVKAKLSARNLLGLNDYRGHVDSTDGYAYRWERQLSGVSCGLEASIDVKICWDAQPSKRYNTNNGGLGTVGMGARHSDNCSQLIQQNFDTRLNYNVSAHAMSQIIEQNTAPDPYNQTVKATPDTFIRQCKKWYVDIVSSLENFLTEFKRVQMGCMVDQTLLDRTADCWNIIHLANAGTNGSAPVAAPVTASLIRAFDLGESALEVGETDDMNAEARQMIDAASAELEEGLSDSADEADYHVLTPQQLQFQRMQMPDI